MPATETTTKRGFAAPSTRTKQDQTMTHRTILIHRGGWGTNHKLGEITVTPEGTDCHGYERHHVRLGIIGDSNRSSCSCIAESLNGIIAEYTGTAMLKETQAERSARLRRESERKAAKRAQRRKAGRRRVW